MYFGQGQIWFIACCVETASVLFAELDPATSAIMQMADFTYSALGVTIYSQIVNRGQPTSFCMLRRRKK